MPDDYIFTCKCGWSDVRYRNFKKCPKCGKRELERSLMPTDKQVEEMDNKNSHPSSQSLKRISDDTEKIRKIVYEETPSAYRTGTEGKYVKLGADEQLAADQPVVAEKDRKIAELEKQIETLKAQLQPVEDEEARKLIRKQVSRYGGWKTEIDELTEDLVLVFSALIQSRTGKVAGEIFREINLTWSEDDDIHPNCYPTPKFYAELKARYSPESER